MDKATAAPPPYEHQPLNGQPAYVTPTFAPQPGPSTTVAVASLGPQSSRMTCPHCRALIDTATEQELSSIGWLSVVLLFVTTCLCCIPFCIDSCHNVKHCCPNCRAYLGEYRR